MIQRYKVENGEVIPFSTGKFVLASDHFEEMRVLREKIEALECFKCAYEWTLDLEHMVAARDKTIEELLNK